MALPGKAPNKQNTSGRSAIAAFFLLAVIILCTAFFIYLKSRNIDFSNITLKALFADASNEKGSSVSSVVRESEILYDVREHPAFCTYRGSIVKCRADSLSFLDKKGDEIWEPQVSFTGKPFLKVTGAYLMAADLGGRNIYVIRNKEVIWEWNAESRIINADISENGFVAVVQEVKGYKSSVSVFKAGISSDLIFTRNIAENYLLSAKLSPTGRQLVLNRLDSSGITLSTDLEYNNLSSVKPVANIRKNDAVFPGLWYFKDGSLLAAGDSSAVLFDKDRNEIWKADYSGGKLLGACTSLGKYAVIAAVKKADSGAVQKRSEIKVIKTTGQEYASWEMDGRVLNISTSDEVIAANTGNAVYFYNLSGKLVGKYTSMAEIREVYFLDSFEAVIAAWGKITVVKL